MRSLAFGLVILSLELVGCSTTSTTSNDNKQTTGVGSNSFAPTSVEIQETIKLIEMRLDEGLEKVVVLMCEKIKKQDYKSAIKVGVSVMAAFDNPKALGDANFIALSTLLYICYEELDYDNKMLKNVLGGEETTETFAVLFKENLNNPVGVLNVLKEHIK